MVSTLFLQAKYLSQSGKMEEIILQKFLIRIKLSVRRMTLGTAGSVSCAEYFSLT